jgi:hypothetical protein
MIVILLDKHGGGGGSRTRVRNILFRLPTCWTIFYLFLRNSNTDFSVLPGLKHHFAVIRRDMRICIAPMSTSASQIE